MPSSVSELNAASCTVTNGQMVNVTCCPLHLTYIHTKVEWTSCTKTRVKAGSSVSLSAAESTAASRTCGSSRETRRPGLGQELLF